MDDKWQNILLVKPRLSRCLGFEPMLLVRLVDVSGKKPLLEMTQPLRNTNGSSNRVPKTRRPYTSREVQHVASQSDAKADCKLTRRLPRRNCHRWLLELWILPYCHITLAGVAHEILVPESRKWCTTFPKASVTDLWDTIPYYYALHDLLAAEPLWAHCLTPTNSMSNTLDERC